MRQIMSEYQQFEFVAIDRPLTPQEQDSLREFSSRATITSRQFKVDYSWGSFKGDEDKWIDRYFDAFLYLSNWGSRRFILRLPHDVLPLETARRYCASETASTRSSGSNVVLNFGIDNEGEHEWIDEDDDTLARLLPLRADLADGDHRALYLAWLAGISVESGYDDDESDEDVKERENQEEPPCPPGLGKLTPQLEAFAEFLSLDDDLIAAAASASPVLEDVNSDAFESWVIALSSEEKTSLVVRLVRSSAALLRSELLQRFRESRDRSLHRPAVKPRTVGEIFRLADSVGDVRRRKEAEDAAREKAIRDQQEAERRDLVLAMLRGREAEAWSEAQSLIESRKPKKYDEAVLLLGNLRELCAREGRGGEAIQRIARIRLEHAGKKTLIDKMERAGLLG